MLLSGPRARRDGKAVLAGERYGGTCPARPQAYHLPCGAGACRVRTVRPAGFRGHDDRRHRARGRDRPPDVLPVLPVQERRAVGELRGRARSDAGLAGRLPASVAADGRDPAGHRRLQQGAAGRRGLAPAPDAADPGCAGAPGPLHPALRGMAPGDRGFRGRANRPARLRPAAADHRLRHARRGHRRLRAVAAGRRPQPERAARHGHARPRRGVRGRAAASGSVRLDDGRPHPGRHRGRGRCPGPGQPDRVPGALADRDRGGHRAGPGRRGHRLVHPPGRPGRAAGPRDQEPGPRGRHRAAPGPGAGQRGGEPGRRPGRAPRPRGCRCG